MTVEQQLQRLCDALDYPMVIVTAAAAGRRGGCLVGFFTQCSIHPCRFVVCVSQRNATHPVALGAAALGVHLLDEEDYALSRLFGEQTGDEVDKFSLCAWEEGPHGVPVLAETAGYIVGTVLQRHDVGDHTAFVLEPVAAQQRRRVRQLGFQAVRGMEPGHEP